MNNILLYLIIASQLLCVILFVVSREDIYLYISIYLQGCLYNDDSPFIKGGLTCIKD